MADNKEKAWHAGYDAGANREPETANPYKGESEYYAWLDGWKKGIDPDFDEKD